MLKSQLLSQVRRGFLYLKKDLAVQSYEHTRAVFLKLRTVRFSPAVTWHYPVHHQTLSLSTAVTRLSNSSRNGDSTTPLDSLFQWLTTLLMKKILLVSNLKLPWQNMRLFPLFLLFYTWQKRLGGETLTSLQAAFRLLQRARSLLQAKQLLFPQLLLIKLCALHPS